MSATRTAPQPAPPPLADDLLTGARAIAEYLGWPERRVYHVAEKTAKEGTGAPIRNVPGAGLCALKSRLDAYFREFGNTRQKHRIF